MNPLTHAKQTILPLLLTSMLACFGLLPQMQAVSPPPDGCYSGFTTAEGCNALKFLTTGAGNTGVGWYSLSSDTSGNYNTGVGAGTLLINNGDSNTAVGAAALLLNTTGTRNTAVGTDALVHNGTGIFNDAVGAFALFDNTAGTGNNALGESALLHNQIGSANTAVGDVALANNDSDGAGLGNANTAVGAFALSTNVDGNSNNAVGFNSLGSNSDGLFNNVMGSNAMASNVHGAGNVAVGDSAGLGVEGDFNIYIGAFAGPAPSPSPVPESETIRIGDTFNTACFIGGIDGASVDPGTGVPVFVDATGKLGTVFSSKRFKDAIKPMDKASEAILALQPVTFRYKKELDSKGIPQFGLIAEDVAKVNPNLVVRDPNGDIKTVRYDAVNTMMLNEFLKEHRAFVEEQHKIAQQQKEIDLLKAELKEQRALIQKVGDKVELSQSAATVAAHGQ